MSYQALLRSFVGVVYCQYANDNKHDSHFIKELTCKNERILCEECVAEAFYCTFIRFYDALFYCLNFKV